ncbi:MAG TPA: A24 family peptidase C-terminal domain-containing protein [Methanomassiliicoccales archaeon]|nr:A24 family peptidase C-terminal domain-containing protein [Methanomassiliicoccales archaeon]
MEELTWARIFLAITVMVAASISDWRSRTASDAHWYIMGLGGSLLFGMQLVEESAPWIFLACLALISLVFVDLLRDRRGMFEDGVNFAPLLLYVLTIVAYGYLSLEHFGEGRYWTMLTIPLLILFFFLMYQFDVIKGGADAKALIALSLVFPVYPELAGLPALELNDPAALTILPFPVLVLFNGAILTLLVPVGMLLVNLVRRDLRFPLMLFGTRMTIGEAKKKHVWPMERVADGRVRTVLFPRSDEEADWDALREAGVDRPWVTPKVPFLIPLTLAVPFSLLLGNLLLYLMGA